MLRFGRTFSRLLAEASPSTASAGAADQLVFRFATPSAVLLNDQKVDMVLVPASNGEFGITANHSPTVAALKPGVVQVITNASATPKRYFVSGGFAMVNDNNTASVTVAEAVPLEDVDRELVEQGLAKAETEYNQATDEKAKATAQISVEVHTVLKQALDHFR